MLGQIMSHLIKILNVKLFITACRTSTLFGVRYEYNKTNRIKRSYFNTLKQYLFYKYNATCKLFLYTQK